MKVDITKRERFDTRHNGPNEAATQQMLEAVGVGSLEQLVEETVPASIRLKDELNLPAAVSEYQFLQEFRNLASQNKIFKSYMGMGYYPTIVPAVIQRNILENPGWYTAYTPYQAEIAQGRLEALINFQTMVTDLTGMEIANASLLDAGTAAAEAMSMFLGLRKKEKKSALKLLVDENLYPQVQEVLQTRSEPIGVELVVGDVYKADLTDPELFAMILQYPDSNGSVKDYSAIIAAANEQQVKVGVVTDLLALTLLTPPGEMGADAVVGTSQRLGVPMGYGGPHAAFFATKEAYKRLIPGRIIGASLDKEGNPAYRMALQTREQHIRREKATSNICTAQVLLAVMAGMYGVYHGADGLRHIAARLHGQARLLANALESMGLPQVNEIYFDTLKIELGEAQIPPLKLAMEKAGINLRYFDTNHVGIAISEPTTFEDLQELIAIFESVTGKTCGLNLKHEAEQMEFAYPAPLARTSDYMTHPVFSLYHSEHEMLRYMKRLENKDLSLVHSMISLGSCTMKLNATSEMIPVTWPEFGEMHPFAPVEQTAGYQQLFNELRIWLSEITGFADVSLQPNSGAQGEYAGLMVIRAYHHANGNKLRDIALIPSSAHGTNPASAVMAGMKVVIVGCDELGNIDLTDLRAKAEEHKDALAALMVTYPSTHGVFEESIIEICDIIHQYGGQVYMDGANMNAQVGLTSPANIGADVCHLNLHKTFCIPHGGGGPGMGPIGVAAHLVPFLPTNSVIPIGGEQSISAISSTPYGSASILPISYAYIAMMGVKGLKRATELAILNANYMKKRLEGHYPILYTGSNGRCAHEMILDCRSFKKVGIEVEDIAKRLMDYGYHAPTVSFPVAGTLMVEPTESETKEELDRFCDAMIAIRAEIEAVEAGTVDATNNVLKNAPHTLAVSMVEQWDKPYSREQAAFPAAWSRENKFWPAVSRIDSAYGDRNLMCSCIPIDQYEEEPEVSEELVS